MNKKVLVAIGIFTFIFYQLFTFFLPITDPVESNYVLTAKEMILHNEYLSPLIYGKPWYDKPIFTYWTLIASFKLFGFTDWAARLPATITAALSAMLTYYGGYKIFHNQSISLWSSLILITSIEFWYISHAIVTDGYLYLFSLGIYIFAYRSFKEEANKRKHTLLAFLFAGLAVLTKGPIGIILPGIIFLCYALLKKDKKILTTLFHPWGWLVFLLVALPWYIGMYHIHGSDFLDQFIGGHNYMRATQPEHPDHNFFTLLYLVELPISLLPWTGLTIYQWFRGKRHSSSTYALLWGCIVILFYTLVATKYITYTFIALIPFIYYTAQGLNAFIKRFQDKQKIKQSTTHFLGWITYPLLFLILIGVPALIIFSPPQVNTLPLKIAFPILIITYILAYQAQASRALLHRIYTGIIIFFLAILMTLPSLVENASTKEIVGLLPPITENTDLYYYADYRASLDFYTGAKVTLVIDDSHKLSSPWAKERLVMPHIEKENWENEINSNHQTVVCVPHKYLQNFKELPIAHNFIEYSEGNQTTIFIYKGLAKTN